MCGTRRVPRRLRNRRLFTYNYTIYNEWETTGSRIYTWMFFFFWSLITSFLLLLLFQITIFGGEASIL